MIDDEEGMDNALDYYTNGEADSYWGDWTDEDPVEMEEEEDEDYYDYDDEWEDFDWDEYIVGDDEE